MLIDTGGKEAAQFGGAPVHGRVRAQVGRRILRIMSQTTQLK